MNCSEKARSLTLWVWLGSFGWPACEGNRGPAAAEVTAAAPPVAVPAAPALASPTQPDASQAHTLEGVLRAVAAGKDTGSIHARLQALFERDEAAVSAAVELARAGTGSKVVVEALAVAGTSDAQSALCALVAGGAAPMRVRTEAVSALPLIKHPTQATLMAVGDLIPTCDVGLRRSMSFVAGSVARAGRDAFPAASAAIERALLVAYARTTAEDRIDGLAALGNLGTPAILPRVRAALGSNDARVRAAAARALRLVPDPAADRLLSSTLRHDREPAVRAAAIFAAGFRNVGPLTKALTATAETDPVEYVRAGAGTLLTRDSGP